MKPDQRPIAIDFFCGAGGLSLGFQQAGFRIAAGIDFDPVHVNVHSANFPDSAAICCDVRQLTAAKLREKVGLTADQIIDVVIGGSPCQGFSLIGKRDSRDPRNDLLGELCRLITELKPRYFVIENVSGLMCGKARSVLARELTCLRHAGYRWVTPIRVLDAADFGVPQHRRRVFVLGYRKGENRPEYPRRSKHKVTVDQAIGDLRVLGRSQSLLGKDTYYGSLGLASEYAKRLRRTSDGALNGCLRVSHSRAVITRFKKTKQGAIEPISRFARLHRYRPAPTLRAGTTREYGSFTAPRPIHPTQARCITVREAARLHSFPDWFEFHATQWHGFRQVGNSVPPLLARAVARRVFTALRKRV